MEVKFFKTDNDIEPVRVWLKKLDKSDLKIIGKNIFKVQLTWPCGLPLVRKIEKNIWEIRTNLKNIILRIFFTVQQNNIVLLHGFIKKTQTTPKKEIDIAKSRMKKGG